MSDNEKLVDIASIEARLAKATPGPWRWADWQSRFGTWEDAANKRWLEHNPDYDFRNSIIIREKDDESTEVIELADLREVYKEADLELIEHAPTDIAALLERVRELEAELAEARKTQVKNGGRGQLRPFPEAVEEVTHER